VRFLWERASPRRRQHKCQQKADPEVGFFVQLRPSTCLAQ
jgi:hypothetical protein